MERSEPALVPEWLRSSGSVAGGSSSVHHLAASSSSHTDSSSLANHTRNRISNSSSDFDNSRSACLERSSSSNSRRSSSNGYAKHAYSSFNRNHRDREKERLFFGDHWDRDGSDTLGTTFSGRIEKDTLRRSHSMISRKPGEVLPRRVAVDAKIGTNTSQNNENGVLSGRSIGSGIHKAVFDKDFPSLGTEERPAVSDIIRVSSPVLSTAGQPLPVGSSALIGGEGWTSALAEVPAVIGGSSSGSLSVNHTAAATSVPASSSSTAGLNMAEALIQAPSRARTAPQISVKTQRLEELAIKQSRQLIPVTPPMPKASVFSSEKSKPKTGAKNADASAATKSGLQQPTPLLLGAQSVRSGNVKPDVSVATGKLVVLKPRENGVSLALKDATSPTNNTSGRVGNQNPLAPPVTSAKSPNNVVKPSAERKAAPVDARSGPTLEKRASLSQVQSRNDFFNLIKKKTSKSTSTCEPGPVMSATTMQSSEVSRVVASDPVSPHALKNGNKGASNGVACGEVHILTGSEQDNMSAEAAIYPDEEEAAIYPDEEEAAIYPDEEEAAFLRSLGWEENSGEDEGLTEEEINTFVHQYMKLIPSLKLCQGMQPKLSKLSESCTTNSGGASADLSSSDT